MKRLPVLILIAITIALTCTAQRTTRRGLHAKSDTREVPASEVRPVYDTIAAPTAEMIEVKGYDKPLRSRRETFFATNTGNMPIRRMSFTISYYDLDRHLLHRASHNVGTDIPAGETRMIGVRSWDVQQAFYYTRSAVTHKNGKATPYYVEIAVDTIFTATP